MQFRYGTKHIQWCNPALCGEEEQLSPQSFQFKVGKLFDIFIIKINILHNWRLHMFINVGGTNILAQCFTLTKLILSQTMFRGLKCALAIFASPSFFPGEPCTHTRGAHLVHLNSKEHVRTTGWWNDVFLHVSQSPTYPSQMAFFCKWLAIGQY